MSPFKKFYQRLRDAGHTLELDECGNVDDFAMSYEHHNGPRCVTCGETWCEHCYLNDAVEPCTNPPINGEFTIIAGALPHLTN